jgi:hypothetical protein
MDPACSKAAIARRMKALGFLDGFHDVEASAIGIQHSALGHSPRQILRREQRFIVVGVVGETGLLNVKPPVPPWRMFAEGSAKG